MKPTPTKTQQPPQKVAAPAPAAIETAPAERAGNADLIRPAPTPELNPRNRAAAEIAKRSNQDADVAAAETVPEGDGETMPVGPAASAAPAAPETTPEADETETPPATAPAAAPEAPAATAPSQPAATAPAGIDPNADYDITVDGMTVKLKGSQILSRVQKGEAADYRLQEASRLLAEARRTAGQPAQPPVQGAPSQPAAPAQPAAMDETQLAYLIQFGTTEQAAQAIKALNAQRPDTVTQEGLRNYMAQLPRIVETQLAFREGLAFAKKEYGDLLDDPYLRPLFLHRENEMRKAGDQRPHVELYKAIGDDLRKHFNRPAPAQAVAAPTLQPAATPTMAQKQAAKAAAPAAPRLAAARLEGGAETAKPKTREEIIDGMRKARGQHALSVR